MKRIIKRHKDVWSQKNFISTLLTGFLFFALSLIVNHIASIYVDKKAGSYVQDILLDNLPVVNVDLIINDGVFLFGGIVLYFLIFHPKIIPFTLKSLALFIFIRSIFTTFTHLGPAPSQTYLDPEDLLIKINAGKDMFFSGHTGMPFLLALIFWDNKFMRYLSISASLIFGVSVLLGHLHYSIDVFAAYFITYAIYNITVKVFAKDFQLINGEAKII
jgi:hypothetical protein